jgi:type IV pilus assembly protein PilB
MGKGVQFSVGMRLGDILVDRGVITEEQLAQAVRYQSDTGARLGEALSQLAFITPVELHEALAWQSSYGVSGFGELLPHPQASRLLTEKFCRARGVLPVNFDGEKVLILAMVDPADVVTVDDVRLITGLEVRAVVTTAAAIREAWDLVFAGQGRLEVGPVPVQVVEPEERRAAEHDAVISIVDDIILTAMRRKASDIHFEPQEDGLAVRLRVDGILYPLPTLDSELRLGVVSRIKILGDMNIADKRLPQDGRATFRTDEGSIDLRIATVPTVHGENVTVRLLDDRGAIVTLEQLGMDEHDLALFRQAIKRPWGEVLVTGPTGSGKSTTLYAGLEEINNPKVKIYTVEDPVERRIAGVMQSQARSNIGLTFASLLRALVRSDPDIIMVGEIRDHETAIIATEASLTGHLVLSTLHTNDAPTAITRLSEMGIPAYLIASALELVVAQRLARRLCDRCKETVTLTEAEMSEEEKNFLGLGIGTAQIARPVGCSRCYNTGYSGRVGLFEVLPVTREIRRLILDDASADQIRDQAVAEGIRGLREDGRLKVLAGMTSIAEVLRVTM